MKTLLLFVSIMFFGVTSFAQKTDKEIKKEIGSKAIKSARKEAKKYKKEGWDVSPGSLPLEKMIEATFIKFSETTDKGRKRYISVEGNGVGETKTAADMQALTVAKLALASQIQSNVNALLSSNIANQQLNNEDAASITQTLANSKEVISAQLGYVDPIFKIYRTPKGNNKNTEVLIRIFYDTEQSYQIVKKVIQKDLKDKLKINEEQLDKMMGINE